LTELGEKLGLSDALVKQVIASENRTYYGYFSRCADIFCDGDFKFYSLGVTNSNYAIPLSSFLEKELGWIPLQTYITDQLRDEQKQAFQSVYDAAGLGSELIFETDTSRISKAIARRLPNSRGQRYFDDIGPVFIVGSSLEKELSLQRKAPLLSVSYPVYNRIILDRGYAGYRGGLHLFEDLLDVIMTPR
jgi:nitrogenase molybdenum-iron protein beta chain